MVYVLDASAMIAYLNGEPGALNVAACLLDPQGVCLAHAINLCEIYYQAVRDSGEVTAELALSKLAAVGVQTRSDFDAALWKQAGKLKGRIGFRWPTPSGWL